MESHALAVLAATESWNWPLMFRIQDSEEKSRAGKFKAITQKLLSGFITESQLLGGTLLDQFWVVAGKCHPKFKENVAKLQRTDFSSSDQSAMLLFEGVDRKTIDFSPVFDMAAELFTHLGVAFMNAGGPKSEHGTLFSVSDMVAKETAELLQLAVAERFGTRKQAALKAVLLKRDGPLCTLTGASFERPILAHVIPNSVHDKPDTLKCIAMLAGSATRDVVMQQLNSLGNLMNLQSDAHTAYDNLDWGIQAESVNETVKYTYRRFPYTVASGPEFMRLHDGDEIVF